MSRAAPVVEGPQRAIVTHAFKLVNDTSIGLKHPKTARLPALKDGDPKGSMEGSFLTIEAKNILIAAMAGSKWDKLVQMDKNVPDPAKQSFDYNITTWKHWPDDVEVDGIVGMAADAQANIVAQLAFKNLVHQKKVEKAEKNSRKRRGQADDTDGDVEMGDDDDDEEDLQDVEDDAASLNTLETATTPGFVVDDEEQLRAVPNPKSKPRNYRLTRDWEYWPSAGELPHACSNAQQAQYGLMADLLFETMKIQMKPNQTRPGKKTKPSQALDDAVERLIDNDVTTNILITLLEQHVEQGGKVFQKKSAKNAMQGSVDFRQFVNEQDVIDFNEEGVEERSTIQDKLADLNADMMFELYLRLGREHAKRERAAKKADEGRGRGAQQAGQTSAADQVEDEDDDEPVVPSRKRRRTSQGL